MPGRPTGKSSKPWRWPSRRPVLWQKHDLAIFSSRNCDRESPLSVENIIKEVRAEISRLHQVLALLGAGSSQSVAAKKKAAPSNATPRRKLSAAARKRIAAAQRARWAKIRAAAKK